jgi:hypothetical protein
MRLRERYRRLNFWNKVQFWGAIAGIVGIVLTSVAVLRPTAKPLLTMDVAWAASVGELFPGRPRRYVGALMDLCTQKVLPGSMREVTVDFAGRDVLKLSNRRQYIGKLIIKNSGSAVATAVRIVFGTKVEIEPKLQASLNIEASVSSLGEMPGFTSSPYRYQISIANIPQNRTGFITIYWFTDSATTTLFGEVPGTTEFFVPDFVEFSSKETEGKFGGIVSFLHAGRIEMVAIGEVRMPPLSGPVPIPPGATMHVRPLFRGEVEVTGGRLLCQPRQPS